MRRQLLTGLVMTIALTVLLGIVYPLAVTGLSQVVFPHRADGSLAKNASGSVVGSSLLGQNFVDAKGNPDPRYFQPRPSAAGPKGYDGGASAASNLGPSNPALLQAVKQRVDAYRKLNGLPAAVLVPVDAVTASGSGLDPEITLANARLQVPRVARVRGVGVAVVMKLVTAHTENRQWGFIGEKGVNVLELNLALDRMGR